MNEILNTADDRIDCAKTLSAPMEGCRFYISLCCGAAVEAEVTQSTDKGFVFCTVVGNSSEKGELVYVIYDRSGFREEWIDVQRDKFCFWSGYGRYTVNGDRVAKEYALKSGRKTLEMCIEEARYKDSTGNVYRVAMIPWTKENNQVWKDVSEIFASKACGHIVACIGPGLRESSIWRSVEFPRVLSSSAVTRITEKYHDPHTDDVIVQTKDKDGGIIYANVGCRSSSPFGRGMSSGEIILKEIDTVSMLCTTTNVKTGERRHVLVDKNIMPVNSLDALPEREHLTPLVSSMDFGAYDDDDDKPEIFMSDEMRQRISDLEEELRKNLLETENKMYRRGGGMEAAASQGNSMKKYSKELAKILWTGTSDSTDCLNLRKQKEQKRQQKLEKLNYKEYSSFFNNKKPAYNTSIRKRERTQKPLRQAKLFKKK